MKPLPGLLLAFSVFTYTFGGPRTQFWQRMTLTGLSLGGFAIASEQSLRRPRVGFRDVLLGVASAAGLYAIFHVGDRLARVVMPRGGEEIGEIYALRSLRPKNEIAARLAGVIGPAEELFWRGHVQRRLIQRLGPMWGTVVACGCYGGAHLVSRNATLVGAASVAGIYWSVLAVFGMPLAALIVSHISWDIWIFLVAPTESILD